MAGEHRGCEGGEEEMTEKWVCYDCLSELGEYEHVLDNLKMKFQKTVWMQYYDESGNVTHTDGCEVCGIPKRAFLVRVQEEPESIPEPTYDMKSDPKDLEDHGAHPEIEAEDDEDAKEEPGEEAEDSGEPDILEEPAETEQEKRIRELEEQLAALKGE